MDNNEVVTEEVAAVVENNTGIEIEPLFDEQVDFDTFSKSDFRVVKVKNCEAVPKSKKLLRFTLDDGTENERTILSGVHAFYEPQELVGNRDYFTALASYITLGEQGRVVLHTKTETEVTLDDGSNESP